MIGIYLFSFGLDKQAGTGSVLVEACSKNWFFLSIYDDTRRKTTNLN